MGPGLPSARLHPQTDSLFPITTLVADDVDGWCAAIVERGGVIDSGPEHSSTYAIHHAFLRDPDGNVLEIQRFDDPNWASGP